jgi:hypothetical protein
MLSGGTPSRRSACFILLWLCSKLAERKPILFIVYVLLVSVILTQGSRTSKPPKRRAILTKVPQKGQLIFLEKLKNVKATAVWG